MCKPSTLNYLSAKFTYPEINLEVASSTELPIPYLKCHSHLIILVQNFVEAFPRVGAQVDVVCKRRGKEAQECAEKEGGAHRGQSGGPQTLRATKKKSFGAYSPDIFQFSGAKSRDKQTLTKQVDMRDIFSSWHRGVGICRVVAEREIIWPGHNSLLLNHENLLGNTPLRALSK